MSPSNERSAEWLRGAVESHINTCNLITSITSATKSHPAWQGLMAAGNELHNQLDRYRTLLAAAEAREATQPTAAEVIEACRVALASDELRGYVALTRMDNELRRLTKAANRKVLAWIKK